MTQRIENQSKKINETKSWFFEKINKIDKVLARLRKKEDSNKISNERGDKTTHATEITGLKETAMHDPTLTNQDDLEETDKFLETYNLPRLNHEEIENKNRPITCKAIEPRIKNFSAHKSLGPDGSRMNSVNHLKNS